MGLKIEERTEVQEADLIEVRLCCPPMDPWKKSNKVLEKEDPLHQDNKGDHSSSLNMDQVDVDKLGQHNFRPGTRKSRWDLDASYVIGPNFVTLASHKFASWPFPCSEYFYSFPPNG